MEAVCFSKSLDIPMNILGVSTQNNSVIYFTNKLLSSYSGWRSGKISVAYTHVNLVQYLL